MMALMRTPVKRYSEVRWAGRSTEWLKTWWAGTGLNRRHQDFQSCALPTELPAHQTRKNSKGVWACLFDGRDDPDGARLLEEERDDDDLARPELARELGEKDARARRLEAYERDAWHGQPRKRRAAGVHELRAPSDGRLDEAERTVKAMSDRSVK